MIQSENKDFSFDNRPVIGFQWHLTTKCSNFCKHCYMYDEDTYAQERKNTLPLNSLIKILDDLETFEKKYNAYIGPFGISGGDPLLRGDLFEFLSELKKRNKYFVIMGNPELLEDKKLTQLSDCGLKNYQLSLDGLEKTHDFFRSIGSFKRTIEKIQLIREHDIDCNIMFTLYPSNANELIPLMRFLAKNTKATSFSFDIGVMSGNANSMKNQFTANEIHKLFKEFYHEKKRLKEQGYSIFFHEKSNFHKLIHFENNELYPIVPKNGNVLSGVYTGWNTISLISDGSVLACRKMPLKIGKMPEQSFEEIFLENTLLKKLRRPQYFRQCGTCDFYAMCRGCVAYAYGITKDPFAKPPLCFRNEIPKKTDEADNIQIGPSLDTTREEEWEYISQFSQISKLPKFLKEKDFQYTYLDLVQEAKEFLSNPLEYVKNSKRDLSHDQIAFLIQRFSSLSNTINPKLIASDPLVDCILNIIFKELHQNENAFAKV